MMEKQRREKPYHVDKGTVIGVQSCPCCKKNVQVKINVSGKAYFNCTNFNEHGNDCGYQVRYGAGKSEAMRKAYHERLGRGRADVAPVAANDDRPPERGQRDVTPVTRAPSIPQPMPERTTANEDRAPVAPRQKKGAIDEYGY